MAVVPACIAAVGGLATALASVAFHMPASDALRLAWTASGAAIAVGLVGLVALLALRRRSLGLQVTAVALVCVGAAAAGSAAAARGMFIAHHDLDTMVVILLAAGTVGGVVAAALGTRIAAASRALEHAARRIGEGDLRAEVPEPTAGEFAAVGRELRAMAARLEAGLERERALDASRREVTSWVSHDRICSRPTTTTLVPRDSDSATFSARVRHPFTVK